MDVPTKLVMVLRVGLDAHLGTNAAAVLGLSLGARLGHLLGSDGKDAAGGVHAGLNTHPVPVLTASAQQLRELHAAAAEWDELLVVGFTEVARRARDYDDYLAGLAVTPAADIDYLGLAVFGPRSRVTALTKRLPLLR